MSAYERDRETVPLCVVLFIVTFAVGVVFVVHVGVVELVTRDSHPPPACQHFPTSSRCIKMELTQCMDECKAPNLAVYIGRYRSTNVLVNVAFHAIGRMADGDEESEAIRERKLHSSIYHGASILGTLLTTERTHAARCMAACLAA